MRVIFGVAGIAFLIGISANVASSDTTTGPQVFTVAENAAPGAVVGRVGSRPEDSSVATYTVVHDGRAVPFVIDRHTGELTLADSPLDFEVQPRHGFVVRSRRPRPMDDARRAYLADLLASGVDPATLDDLLFETVEQQIAVLIADAPEPPSLSAAPLQLRIDETGKSASAQIVALDPDAGDALTFELLAGEVEPFEIDPQSGMLTYRDSVAAVAGTYPVTVRVTDTTGLSDAATFNIEVTVAAPSVAAGGPTINPTEQAANAEPVESAVTVVPEAAVDDPESIIVGPGTVVVVPETPGTPVASGRPETFVEPEPDTDPDATVSTQNAGQMLTPLPAATPVDATPSPLAAGTDAEAVGTSGRSILHWLPLLPVLAGAAFAAVWYWRRRREQRDRATRGQFRVVRDAPEAAASKSAESPIESVDQLLEPRLLSLENEHAHKAAMHELMATAFQQAAGLTRQQLSPPPLLTESAALEIVESGTASDESLEATAGPLPEEPAAIPEPGPESACGFDAALAAEAGLEFVPEAVGAESEPRFGTEPFAMPNPEAGQPVAEQSIEAELAAAHAAESPLPTSYGYGVEDEELAGGYQGLRLSGSSAPAAMDDPAADEYGVFETQEVQITAHTSLPEPEAEDPKLHELRRQLSDLFGVPADRPRSAAPPVYDDEPVDAEGVADEAAAETAAPLPVAPPPPPVVVAAPVSPETEPAAPEQDPVNSWLEYLKQRALEKPGAPAAPFPPATAPQAPRAPSKPAISAATLAAARKSTTPPPVRPNKSAVREEITMLRDLANRHSRNVLARRALNQKARMTWVLWGTALIVLCFSALWGVRHDAGGVRILGWVLLGGAAIALGCCIYGFRSLSRGPAEGLDEEDLDATRLAEDLEATAAPDLMTPEMEQRLREVLEEARNVPEAVEST